LGLLDSIKKKPSDKGLPVPPPFLEGPPLNSPAPTLSVPTNLPNPPVPQKVVPNPPPAPPKDMAFMQDKSSASVFIQDKSTSPIQNLSQKDLLTPPPIFEETKPSEYKKPEIPKLPEIPPVPKFDIPASVESQTITTLIPPKKPEQPRDLSPSPMIRRPEPPKDFISHSTTIKKSESTFQQSRELPTFPVKREVPKDLPKIPDIEVPEPPPNLRSELTPLELEKLEQQYLGKRITIDDVEQPFQYKRHEGVLKPLYVRTDEYRKMLDNFIDIKNLCTALDETVFRLENLKKNQDNELADYKSTSEDIQRKLLYIDKTIFEGS
jgi:hypothetical protein